MKLVLGNFDNPKVNELLNKHFVELRTVSPAGSTQVLDIAGLKDQTIKFWSFWDNDNLVGCGALKLLDKNHGEFKSIRVSDNYRKKGIGEKIINQLILEAKNLDINKISIETGTGNFFESARKLFIKTGFEPCEPFAHYKKDINSCYYTKAVS